ncbi:nuclear transport factor 2 family protein [Allonocardiopsis opalescens]|uniref:SnoaL-like protein n=1 Tax=Allonocardiopsis opalescens TaxID=1144618 RepID=A0A2T0PZX2_9ACTN|nr:nuclear transport factor 2 family protein [Allonocardiopsis opalescens]PRX97087.1 SnoaL-like protein [Allonocardiopsis opalescens]
MTSNTADRLTSEEAVRTAAVSWFAALDRKEPFDRMVDYFDLDRLYLRFPEGEFHGRDGFARWYDAAMNTYFDTKHTVHEVGVDIADDGTADVRVFVTWQARTWKPPAATSESVAFDIRQSWRVVADGNGAPRVRSYVVEEVEPAKGLAARPSI